MDRTAARNRMIRQIVQRESLETQQELVRALRRRGIRTTQATVSRDIKRLGLMKVPAADGRYRYALPGVSPTPAPGTHQRLRSVVEEFVRGVETGLDLILVKTEPGGAAPVSQAIDDVRWPEIAGTLAGENTILVVPRRKTAMQAVLGRLRKLMSASE